MSMLGDLLVDGASVFAKQLIHEFTPIGVISSLTLLNLIAAYSLGLRMVASSPAESSSALTKLVTLWMLSSISILLCTSCIIVLHSHGID